MAPVWYFVVMFSSCERHIEMVMAYTFRTLFYKIYPIVDIYFYTIYVSFGPYRKSNYITDNNFQKLKKGFQKKKQ